MVPPSRSVSARLFAVRVDRAFAFVDLSGFTAFSDHEGDEAAVDVLHKLRDLVRDVASDRGVRVAKWLGDGAMFVSVDRRALIETVLTLQREFDGGLELRAGAAAGPTILFEGDDYVGGAVNLASRLSDAARPGELLAEGRLARSAPEWSEVSDVDNRRVPGFEEPVRICRIVDSASGP